MKPKQVLETFIIWFIFSPVQRYDDNAAPGVAAPHRRWPHPVSSSPQTLRDNRCEARAGLSDQEIGQRPPGRAGSGRVSRYQHSHPLQSPSFLLRLLATSWPVSPFLPRISDLCLGAAAGSGLASAVSCPVWLQTAQAGPGTPLSLPATLFLIPHICDIDNPSWTSPIMAPGGNTAHQGTCQHTIESSQNGSFRVSHEMAASFPMYLNILWCLPERRAMSKDYINACSSQQVSSKHILYQQMDRWTCKRKSFQSMNVSQMFGS